MKKYYIILLVFYMTYWANAQNEPCPPTGVTTNPQNPQNPQSPFYSNHFDWTTPFYDVFFEGGNTTTMGNPFASNQGAMRDLDEGDTYFHEDGWELVFVDFGLNRSGQPLASGEGSGQLWFMLYNKYRSIIRVFTSISDEKAQNNLIQIKLGLNNTGYNTAIFSGIDKVQL